MGFIRSGAALFLSSLLFVSIFLTGIFLTFNWSIEYENVEPVVLTFVNSTLEDLGVENFVEYSYDEMMRNCENEMFYTSLEFEKDIPCSEISQGPEAVSNYIISSYVEQLYYKEYNCSFFECIKDQKEPYVLISNKAKEYFGSKFRLALIISFILFGSMFLVFASKHSVLIVSGILTIIASLPFRKVNWALALLPSGDFSSFFMLFFTKAYNVFVAMIIIGAILLVIGLMFEFLGWGIGISKFFGLFRGKEIWEEKQKQRKNKKGQFALGEEKDSFTKEEVQEIVREELEKVNTSKD